MKIQTNDEIFRFFSNWNETIRLIYIHLITEADQICIAISFIFEWCGQSPYFEVRQLVIMISTGFLNEI